MKKKGSALILTIAIIAFLLILGGAIIMTASSSTISTLKVDNLDYLRLAAESGVEKGFAYLKVNYSSIPVKDTLWSDSTSVKVNVESGKYIGTVTLYNYDINDPNSSTKFAKYTIKSTVKTADNKYQKTITAFCAKDSEDKVYPVPYIVGFEDFFNVLTNNVISLINPLDNNKKKDFFINAGSNTSFNVIGNSYFQGKLNGNPFDKKSVNITPDPVQVTGDSANEVKSPSINDLIPQKDLNITSSNSTPVFKYSDGSQPMINNIGGINIILVKGNVNISGSFTCSNYIIYSTGVVNIDKDCNVTFNNSIISAQVLDFSNHINFTIRYLPNLDDTQKEALKSYLLNNFVKDAVDNTKIVSEMISKPYGNLFDYKEE